MFLNTTKSPNSSHPANGSSLYHLFEDSTKVYKYQHPGEISPLLPFGMILIVSTVIFILIVFRRWPGLAAGIVAGCLTSVSIYLLLIALKEQRVVYE